MKVGILCGGPSLERGISLNSARSVLDHLGGSDIEIIPVYFDHKKNAYKISTAQLYSNTPSDFDFKLQQTATPLNEKKLIDLLKSVDIVFSVMHGSFGEDGEIQFFLEKNAIPYVGSSSEACKRVFDKFLANQYIKSHGFFTLPSVVFENRAKASRADHKKILEKFFKDNKISRAIVKPARSGSSIGVFSVSTVAEALEKTEFIFSKGIDSRVVVEPFAGGIEFTTIILQNRFGQPVAILPTEIETDYAGHKIFDFRKKYLPTRQVVYHCPPRFSDEIIEKIQVQAEQIFSLFGMSDFARFDGWLMSDGRIWFSDFNPIGGMEQNSFLFQQASRVGFSHGDFLRFIVKRACARYIKFPEKDREINLKKEPINVLFGGNNSERQVSLMSGTNVWLKLRKSKLYEPKPHLLGLDGNVWELPYAFTLNHTVEEILENCKNMDKKWDTLARLRDKVRLRLALLPNEADEPFVKARKMKLSDFISKSTFVFIALHGGDGENGVLQKMLTAKGVKYNGPDETVSRLCMDKWDTNRFIERLKLEGVGVAPAYLASVSELEKQKDMRSYWNNLRTRLDATTVIVKPRADGCSSGIVHLYSAKDLNTYIRLIKNGAHHIPKGTFKNQADIIEMPQEKADHLLFEKFIETDQIRAEGNKLRHVRRSGFVEITVGVVEEKGKLHIFNPSLTVAEGEVLSVEEKFQGGTGINITPPPGDIIRPKTLLRAKELIGKVATTIGIKGYSRIDAFVHIDTGDIVVIEVNTLPGLTPSTVFYHQALAEEKPLFPRELLERLITNSSKRAR